MNVILVDEVLPSWGFDPIEPGAYTDRSLKLEKARFVKVGNE